MSPANLSNKKTISFWAKGDGRTYTLALITQGLQGVPPMKMFAAGPEWNHYSFALSDFDADKTEVTSLAFVNAAPGKFEFELDEVEIK